ASDGFRIGSATPSAGRLTLTVQTGRDGLGWAGLPASPPGRFPGGVIAVRAAAPGPHGAADGVYVALPSLYLAPGETATFFVADDGASYTSTGLEPASLARPAPGSVAPPRPLTARTALPVGFIRLDRGAGGMRVVDRGRFAGAGVLFTAELFSGALEPLGAIATINRAAASHLDYVVPDPWPAFTYGPSQMAVSDANDTRGKLVIRVTPLAGATRTPQTELVVVNRAGRSLLVYLPELAGAPAEGVVFLVADDGSTWFPPAEADALTKLDNAASLEGLTLARASAGQVLSIPGFWPLQQRRPMSLDLCDCARGALLHPDEIGIDPEIGRFALAAGDPAIGSPDLTVDYVEAFSGEVGARTFDRELQPVANPATLRLVSRSGDGVGTGGIEVPPARRHGSIAQALANAADGDVIEIVDSATYVERLPAPLAAAAQTLTVRAAPGQRPCLAFYAASGAATAASLQVVTPMSALNLNGLLISGGPVQITRRVDDLELLACTLDPRGDSASLIASDDDAASLADYLLCRCITGGVRTAPGVARLTIADSIVNQPGGLAIAGFDPAQVEPALRGLHLERTTVLGRIRCDTLEASECLLDETAIVNDRQVGCIRFSRFELGSALPRRFQCVPSDAQATACPSNLRCLPPLFQARRLGRPDYAQLASATSPAILTGSEAGAEVGAFASRRNAIRQGNLEIKLREFLPVGLRALLIAET
ncbi:MAG: hypothetical protein K0R44_3054, partial [Thermomicrobiales bacterium]|nr:hypothetical protein [Thermomicrobiales bacterium]